MEFVISIHALLAESDWNSRQATVHTWKFLSTLSLRRATVTPPSYKLKIQHFYPRSPCGERLVQIGRCCIYEHISIHALLAESDAMRRTYPVRVNGISIHALLAESDPLLLPVPQAWQPNFYPRSPCGERLSCVINNVIDGIFLSTLSLRRATEVARSNQTIISHFYPRSPCGERRETADRHTVSLTFLSTLSLRRATWARGSRVTYVEFLSTLSLRRATRAVNI